MLNHLNRLVMAGALTMILGCGNSDVRNSPDSTNRSNQDDAALAGEATRQQFGAFSFEVPGGWSSVTPDRDKTKAIVLLGGTNWQNSRAMIKVNVGTPAFPTRQEMADDFAKRAGGQVAPETLDFGGEAATKVTTTSTTLATPRAMMIIYRDGKAYLVMAGALGDVDLADAIEHIRSTWKWEG
jgi:hypothetical protein